MAAAARPEVAIVRTVENTNVPALITSSKMARAYIQPLLPPGVSLEEVGAQTRLALAKDKTGALKKCTVGSVVLAVAKACGQGLVIGETAHLVPFGIECTMLRDYTGDIQLAIQSGMVRRVEAYVVYAKEVLKITRGSRTEIHHEPILDPTARGELVGVYAIVHLPRYEFTAEYMTIQEVDAIRQAHSKQWKTGAMPRWYLKKTVIRQALKLIPKTAKLSAILATLDGPTDASALDAALTGGSADPSLSATNRVADVPPPVSARLVDDDVEPQESDWDLDDDEPAVLDIAPLAPAAAAPAPPAAAAPAAPPAASTPLPLETDAKCPVCSGAMLNQSLSKTNVKAPDFICKNDQCDGKFWPGQYPPKPPATEAQLIKLTTLMNHPAIPTRTRTSVKGLLEATARGDEKGLKTHRAAEAIEKLEKIIADFVPAALPADEDDDLPF